MMPGHASDPGAVPSVWLLMITRMSAMTDRNEQFAII
jgi:hypothetical protein